MKVVYWSPIHGQAGTTSNIITTSLIAGIEYRKKILLTQTQFNYNNLEAPFVGSNSSNRASKNYFMDVGLDTLIRCFKAAKIDKETLENCCISPSNTNLLLLSGTTKINRETFDHEMESVMIYLLRNLEEVYGNIFVDISSGDNQLSQILIADADITVVNLCQNIGVTELYFKNFKDVIAFKPGKVFFLIGNYDCKSKYNISNLRRKYHQDITPSNSGVIPYNTGFHDAQCDGKAVEFIRNNLHCTKEDDNHYFIQKAKSAAEKILKMAGVIE
jgi:hypothetical protein